MLALPSALPSPKVKTHLPDFAATGAGFAAGLATGLAGLKAFRELRDVAADLPRVGADDFDFAATFFVFEAALAMATKSSARGARGRKIAGLTPRFAGSPQAAEAACATSSAS